MADISFTSSKTGEALTEQQNIVAERTKAEQIKNNFYTALGGPANNGLAAKYNAMTGGQKSTALNTLINWDMGAASPSAARENGLYVAVCLLFVCVGYLAVRVGFKRPG